MVDQPPERPGKCQQQHGRAAREQQAPVQQCAHQPPDIPAPAGDLRRRQLRHEQIRQRVQQARGEEHHRQRHAVHDAVARERAVGRQAGAFEPARDEQVLQRRQRRARIGRHGQRQRHGEHPPRQVRHGVAAAAVFAPVECVHRRHQQQRHHVRARAASRDGGAALLQVAGGRKGQKPHHARDTHQLFEQVHERRLPHAAGGGEISVHDRRERDARQADACDAQRAHRARVADPEKAHGLGQKVHHRARAQAEKQRVARAPAHCPRDASAALEPHLLGDQARGGKADAGDGEGGKQHAHRHDELVQPDAGRADAPDDPRLKDEPDAAHHDRRAGHERGVDDEPAISVHARDLPTQFVPLYGAGAKNMPPDISRAAFRASFRCADLS